TSSRRIRHRRSDGWEDVMRLFSAAILATMCLTGFAAACDVCIALRGDALALPHPRAIEVAVATRAALDKGLLRPAPASAPVGGWNRRDDASGAALAKAWAEKLSAAPLRPETFSLHVVLVDTSEAFVIHVRGGRAVVEPGGVGAEAAAATTSITLRALVGGE